jgi:hypothetical protein
MRPVAIATIVAALAAIASGTVEQQKNTLSSIDTVPTRQQLDNAFDSPQEALDNLASLATNDASDVGIRLRAIHALAKYCAATPCVDTDVAHQAVVTVLNANAHEQSGSNALLLRAAVETIGVMRVAGDVGVLVPAQGLGPSLLDHPSRDVRATTARALQELCNTVAITPLRVRYSHESSEQVKLAISEALRILGQCSSNP